MEKCFIIKIICKIVVYVNVTKSGEENHMEEFKKLNLRQKTIGFTDISVLPEAVYRRNCGIGCQGIA